MRGEMVENEKEIEVINEANGEEAEVKVATGMTVNSRRMVYKKIV
jgi:hypothetical protein